MGPIDTPLFVKTHDFLLWLPRTKLAEFEWW
jgi:hypothetical protein